MSLPKSVAPYPIRRFVGTPTRRHADTPTRLTSRERIAEKHLLVPIWVNQWNRAGSIELADLFCGQVPTNRAEVVTQLSFVACADDDGSNGRPLKQPVDCNLRYRLSGFRGDLIKRIDHVIKIFIRDLWTHLIGDRATLASDLR